MTKSKANQAGFSSVSKTDLKCFLKMGVNERKIIKSSVCGV
jgi:hypothetical protein